MLGTAVTVEKLSVETSQALMLPVWPLRVSVPELLPGHCIPLTEKVIVPPTGVGVIWTTRVVEALHGGVP